MRTYTLESVEKKIANYEQFIARARKKETELVKLRQIRDDLLSPENAQKAIDALERKRAEIARLEKYLNSVQDVDKSTDSGDETDSDFPV